MTIMGQRREPVADHEREETEQEEKTVGESHTLRKFRSKEAKDLAYEIYDELEGIFLSDLSTAELKILDHVAQRD